jgi:hypothetical protein
MFFGGPAVDEEADGDTDCGARDEVEAELGLHKLISTLATFSGVDRERG